MFGKIFNTTVFRKKSVVIFGLPLVFDGVADFDFGNSRKNCFYY